MSQAAGEMAISLPATSPGRISVCDYARYLQSDKYAWLYFTCQWGGHDSCSHSLENSPWKSASPLPAMPGSGLPLSHQLTSEPIAERSSEDLNEGIRGGMHRRREGERDALAMNENGWLGDFRIMSLRLGETKDDGLSADSIRSKCWMLDWRVLYSSNRSKTMVSAWCRCF